MVQRQNQTGFKGSKANQNPGLGTGYQGQGAAPASRPRVKPLGKTPTDWGRFLKLTLGAAAVIASIIFLAAKGDEPKRKPTPNRDTAPKATGHDWHKAKRILDQQRRSEQDPSVEITEIEPRPLTRAQSRANERRANTSVVPPGASAQVEFRRGGISAILNQVYNGTASPVVMQESDRIMLTRDPAKPIYEQIMDRSNRFQTHIAAATLSPDGTTNAFICVQNDRQKAIDLLHAQATPDGQGGYSVTLSDKVPHSREGGRNNYLTGAYLMSTFGHANCHTTLMNVHRDMVGTGETQAFEMNSSAQQSERRMSDLQSTGRGVRYRPRQY